MFKERENHQYVVLVWTLEFHVGYPNEQHNRNPKSGDTPTRRFTSLLRSHHQCIDDLGELPPVLSNEDIFRSRRRLTRPTLDTILTGAAHRL